MDACGHYTRKLKAVRYSTTNLMKPELVILRFDCVANGVTCCSMHFGITVHEVAFTHVIAPYRIEMTALSGPKIA